MKNPCEVGEDSRLSLIEKLRSIQYLRAGSPWPAWMNQPGGWGEPLSKLAGEAADALERFSIEPDRRTVMMFGVRYPLDTLRKLSGWPVGTIFKVSTRKGDLISLRRIQLEASSKHARRNP